MEELVGVINLYPWYALARKELCVRMSQVGGEAWGEKQYSDAALYIVSRSIISDIARSGQKRDYSDKDVEKLLAAYIDASKKESANRQGREIRIVGGDYFSQSQYNDVSKPTDKVFSSYAGKARSTAESDASPLEDPDFYTEPLAEIFAEQGYYEQAIKIYSRLILRYPEKNAYFASLIEKLKN